MLGAGGGDELGQAILQPLAAAEFASALRARAQVFQRQHEILAGAAPHWRKRRQATVLDTPRISCSMWRSIQGEGNFSRTPMVSPSR